ncbi:MAG: SLBB domain-containing protein [Firmicutes bacterium]|nr:SLBB domain-containing protein [Bacillota bacterium]
MNLIEKIEAAGVVGCGGAGFPTHRKLSGTFEYLIANGAECEPCLRHDRWLMRNKAKEIVQAMDAIAAELDIPNAVVALKGHYEAEAEAIEAASKELGSKVRVHKMESFYPAGDEQTMVYEVTGRVVPPAGIPAAVGAVVDNVATLYAVWEAMQGIPFTKKFLTVTGEVNEPSVLHVPVGTPFTKCIELAGGAKRSEYFVVTGGPMMGKPVPPEELADAVVTKTTGGILVLPADGYHARVSQLNVKRMLSRAKSACIQCTSCSQLCPRHLLGHPLQPHMIMRKMAMGGEPKDMLDDPVIQSAALCCECGICEVYACPMGLNPRKINAIIKGELREAGIRYERTGDSWTPSPEREVRKAPTDKVAARAGVYRYNKLEVGNYVEYDGR